MSGHDRNSPFCGPSRNTQIAKKLTPLIAGKIVGADGMAEIGPAALAPASDHAGGTEIGFEA
jgi:hypothetical protein